MAVPNVRNEARKNIPLPFFMHAKTFLIIWMRSFSLSEFNINFSDFVSETKH